MATVSSRAVKIASSHVRATSNSTFLKPFLQKNRFSGELVLPSSTRKNILKKVPMSNPEYSCSALDSKTSVQGHSFMLENFYKQAPVPKRLGFCKDDKVTPFLKQEMKIFEDSAVSQIFFDHSNNDTLFGVHYCMAFQNDGEDQEMPSTEEWFNTAASLVEENPGSNPGEIFRKYQLMQLENMCQGVMKKEGAEFTVHSLSGAIDKNYRGAYLIQDMFKIVCKQVWEHGGIVTATVNMPQVAAFIENEPMLKNFRLVDHASFGNISMNINGRNVFQKMEKAFIKFYVLLE